MQLYILFNSFYVNISMTFFFLFSSVRTHDISVTLTRWFWLVANGPWTHYYIAFIFPFFFFFWVQRYQLQPLKAYYWSVPNRPSRSWAKNRKPNPTSGVAVSLIPTSIKGASTDSQFYCQLSMSNYFKGPVTFETVWKRIGPSKLQSNLHSAPSQTTTPERGDKYRQREREERMPLN